MDYLKSLEAIIIKEYLGTMRRIFCVYTITGKLIIYLNILVSAMSHGTSYKFSQPAELCSKY